jgi:hypothetical protein
MPTLSISSLTQNTFWINGWNTEIINNKTMAGIQKSKMETKSLNNDGQIMEHKKNSIYSK